MYTKSFYATVLASVLFVTSCGSDEPVEVKTSYRPVKAIEVSTGIANSAFKYSGLVKSSKESSLSFRVSGNIKSLPVKIGNRVKKGDLLAELDQADYNISYDSALASEKNAEAAMQSAKARISSAEAEKVRAKAAYERAERLYETNSIPLSEFEQARTTSQAADASLVSTRLEYSSAKAQLDSARQQTRSIKNELKYTKLLAPFDGVVSQVLVEENEQINAGAQVLVLSAAGNAEIEVGLPANVISQIKQGDEVSVNFFNLPNKSYKAVVTEVGFTTANSAVYPLVVMLDENVSQILPGMSAEVTLNLKQTETTTTSIILPAAAVGEVNGENYAYVLNQRADKEQGKVVFDVAKKIVVIGPLGSKGFQILSGIEPGMRVAIAGLNTLQEGDVVTLYKSKK